MMSEDNVEILEVGEDGSFDTPSVEPIAKKVETQALDYSNFDWSGILKEDNLEILEKLLVGEYAVYQTSEEEIWIIARVDQEGQVQVLRKNNAFQLRFNNKKMNIELPANLNITGKSISSKQWNGYITITIA
jgi:hypothetical protein